MRIDTSFHGFGEDGLILSFATPILTGRIPGAEEMNRRLEALILERAASERGESISNVGGWQSSGDFLDGEDEDIQTLRTHFRQAVVDVTSHATTAPFQCRIEMRGWANVNRSGDFNLAHRHGGNHWSGVYYVRIDEIEDGDQHQGRLEFRDPRPAAGLVPIPGTIMGGTLSVTPSAGFMVLFPAWLDHQVLPFQGDGTRISIAFNANVREFGVLDP